MVTEYAALIIGVILSMSVHELAHGLMSYVFGDPTAKIQGRLTLNPLKHVDWMGLVCMLLFRFGWAKPVPIDSRYYKNKKMGIVWTSFAGPLANFILGFVCIFIYFFILKMGVYLSFLLTCLNVTAVLSIGFGIFNLLPIPPLDGSKILFAVLPDDLYYRSIQGNQIMLIVFIVLLYTGIITRPLILLRTEILDIFVAISRMILGF